MIQQAIQTLIDGTPLSRADAHATLTDIMRGEASDAQIGAFMAALRIRGESPEIIAGAAQAMRENAVAVHCSDPDAIDIVGTGGDGSNTFNISTTAAFVIAGAGVTVAKHGSYGVSSACGSANVLSELGIQIQQTPERMEQCLRDIGIAFLFAPSLHPAMKHVVGPRRELGVWSLFNILGPLCNPARVKNGIFGVFKPELVPIVADACAQLKMNHQFIVHGNDGLDEFTTTTTTTVTEISRDQLKTYEVDPRELGLARATTEELIGGSPAENAAITRAILDGKRGPKREIVLLNAAFALVAGGAVQTPREGIERAAHSIDSGAAHAKLDALVASTQDPS